MSVIFRLAGKIRSPQILRYERSGLLNFIRPVNLQCSPSSQPKHESHDERNMRLGRPQSPHLSIYKPQLTAVLSISHRATGIVLAGYAMLFSMASLVLECPIDYWIDQLRCAELGPPIIMALKFALAFPLSYHFFNGIRHLLWDTGKFLSIKEVYATGWAMLVFAIGAAVGLSMCS